MTKNEKLKNKQNEAAMVWFNDKTKTNADKVIKAFEKYLNWIANRKYKPLENTGIQFDDIYQAAQLGLFIALTKFDGEHLFTNYATSHIYGQIQFHVERNSGILNYGRCDKRRLLMSKYANLFTRFSSECETTNETHQKIADTLGLELKYVERMWFERCQTLSMDELVDYTDGNMSGCTLHNIISNGDDVEGGLINKIDGQILRKKIETEFGDFSEIKRIVLEKRVMNPVGTDTDIANEHSLSRERIRQIRNEMSERLLDYGEDIEMSVKFNVGDFYKHGDQKFKIVDRGENWVVVSKVHGCVVYPFENLIKAIRVNPVTKIEQIKIEPRGVYFDCWLRASDRVKLNNEKSVREECVVESEESYV